MRIATGDPFRVTPRAALIAFRGSSFPVAIMDVIGLSPKK
jgi:hypothetical protein